MKSTLSVFVSGFIFAIGLGVAGMTDANKVIAFLDLSGGWDPSLGLVMGGAIAVHLVLYRLILRRESPVYRPQFNLPTRRDINLRLIGGAALFGIGWAVGGFCPGPGLVSAVTGATPALLFVGAMAAGMALFHVVEVAIVEHGVRPLERSDSVESEENGQSAA